MPIYRSGTSLPIERRERHLSELSTILTNSEINLSRVLNLIRGTDKNEILNQIMTGALSLAHLDSITRDAFYLGLSQDVNLAPRILGRIDKIEQGNHNWIVFDQEAIPDLERFLIAQNQLLSLVDDNKRVLSARLMMRNILEPLFWRNIVNLSDLVTMSDEDLLIVVKDSLPSYECSLLKDLLGGDLFTLAFLNRLPSNAVVREPRRFERKLERMISRATNVDLNYVAVKMLPARVFPEREVPIMTEHHIRDFGKMSNTLKSLERPEGSPCRVVGFLSSHFADRETIFQAREAARNYLWPEKIEL